MANLLATGAGASEGLDVMLHRLLLEQEMGQRTAALGETSRHNRATEEDARRGQDFAQQGRNDANNEKLADNIRAGADTSPIGAEVDPADVTKRVAAGVPAERFNKIPGLKVRQFAGGSALPESQSTLTGMKSSTPDPTAFASGKTDATSPLNAPDKFKNRGTQSQIQAVANEEDKLGKTGTTPSSEVKTVLYKGKPVDANYHPKEDKYFFQGQDITKDVQHYEKPQAPDHVLVPTDMGFIPRPEVARRVGAGETINPQDPAQVRTRKDLATHVNEGVDQAQATLDEAEKAGVLGPLAGRTYGEFLAGKIGSTGDEKTDELLGQLRMDLSAASSGFAALHGRGGANTGMAKEIEKKLDSTYMSHGLISGGLKSIKGWTTRYATKKGSKPEEAGGGNDADPLGLLGK